MISPLLQKLPSPKKSFYCILATILATSLAITYHNTPLATTIHIHYTGHSSATLITDAGIEYKPTKELIRKSYPPQITAIFHIDTPVIQNSDAEYTVKWSQPTEQHTIVTFRSNTQCHVTTPGYCQIEEDTINVYIKTCIGCH